MSQYDNTNRGSIWRNERKEKDTHPDFTGTINVDGVEYFCDAWKRRPDASERAPALTFSVKRKDKQPGKGRTDSQRSVDAQRPAAQQDDFDSDVPF